MKDKIPQTKTKYILSVIKSCGVTPSLPLQTPLPPHFHWSLDISIAALCDEDIDIGLINKPTLNIPDEDMLKKIGHSPFVFIVESQNSKTGLGIRFGTWLLERGYNPVYSNIGTGRAGNAGISEHMKHQGIDPDSIRKKVVSLLK